MQESGKWEAQYPVLLFFGAIHCNCSIPRFNNNNTIQGDEQSFVLPPHPCPLKVQQLLYRCCPNPSFMQLYHACTLRKTSLLNHFSRYQHFPCAVQVLNRTCTTLRQCKEEMQSCHQQFALLLQMSFTSKCRLCFLGRG